MVLAVTLDAVLNLAPLMANKYGHKGDHFHAIALMLVGIRVAFDTRMFFFFLYKIFHGNRDLFSKPINKLQLPIDSAEEFRIKNNPSEK